MRKTELCFPIEHGSDLSNPVDGEGFPATMTDLLRKLPITSLFLWLFGKSRRAYFLGLVLLFVHMPWPDQCVVAQTQPSAKLAVGHDFWGFKDNAPQGTQAIAQTSDGFLWFGTPLGLYRFDGTRFELFHSPFGDQLPSTNISALFAPPSGGLWIGYIFGGFSFLINGRITNYIQASPTGSVHNFAQSANGVLWAATTSGLWKFDHSQWQHIGPESNVPAGSIREAGFDRDGTLWTLAGGASYVVRATLIYLRPGSSQFQRVEGNLQAIGFTVDADGMVVTSPESKQLLDKSRSDSDNLPSAYPVLRNGSEQIVDRANGVWVLPTSGMLRLDARGRLSDVLNNVSPRNSETYNVNPNDTAKLVDREGNIWFGEQKGVHRFFYSPLIKQELPKNEAAWFAVAADDQGEVWVWITEGAENAKLFRVANGRVESRNSPAGPVGVTYRSPDKTIWFGGTNGLWRLVDGGLVRVDLPKEMADQSPFLQTITQDHSGGMWV